MTNTQKDAFSNLLSVWNVQQDQRAAKAPIAVRTNTMIRVGEARTNMYAARRAA